MKRRFSVEATFWSLLSGVFVIALASSLLAVWFSTTPQLKSFQDETIERLVQEKGKELDFLVADRARFLSTLASTPEVKDAVLGNAVRVDPITLQWESVVAPDGLRRLKLYDFLQDELVRRVFVDATEQFTSAERRAVAAEMLEPDWEPRTFVARFASGEKRGFMLIAVPVTQGGLVEGVLLGEFAIEYAAITGPNGGERLEIVSAAEHAATAPSMNVDYVALPVEDLSLVIRLYPDRAEIAAAGERMLWSVLIAVAAVLLVPFGLFAWFGRNALVQPHLELEASQKLLSAQKRELSELAAVAQKASDAIVVTDLEGKTVWVNPAFEEISGYTADEIIGKSPGALLQGPQTDPHGVEAIRSALRESRAISLELINYRKTGEAYPVLISITPLVDDSDALYGFMAISRDTTEEARQKQALIDARDKVEQQALHDALTLLPNRRALDVALSERSVGAAPDVTLIRIDLDFFKYVNDTLGHAAGDAVLRRVADILREEAGTRDLPVRVGGDEFVLLLADGASIEEARRLAHRLLTRVRAPMTVEGRIAHIGASFGIASTRSGCVEPEGILVAADAALYAAKDAGRNAVRYYSQDLHDEVAHNREVADELRRALARSEFEPFFQPQLDAATGAVIGVEALVRWRSPRYGLLTPDRFLPIADRLSILPEIDAHVLEKSFTALEELRRRGHAVGKLSLNVTMARLQDPAVLDRVLARKPQDLVVAFEVLESVLIDNPSEAIKRQLERLRASGVLIEMDDFGSGHASIIAMRQAVPDAIKIDRRLVFPIVQSDVDRQIVRSIIDIGRSLEIHVIAEGVETEQHAEILTGLGCHTLQGFHFARPMPADALAEFLDARSERRAIA